MTKKVAEMTFMIKPNNHVLIPMGNDAKEAQELTFLELEKLQYDYICCYNVLTEPKKYELSNFIGTFFVTVFLNNDGASFRLMTGYNSKGLMTQEELKNIIRDYEIAKQKKANKEFKTFLLLDLLINSNRRADAIIIKNDYSIGLYDFSEGKVVEKMKKYNSINDCTTYKERKQYIRKQKQAERIKSYDNKIKTGVEDLENIIINKEKLSVKFYELPAKYYDFNYFYNIFIDNNCRRIYIPNSLCFLMKKEDVSNSFFAIPLRVNIDSPFFMTETRPNINGEIINHIYQNNTFIGISLIYLTMFVTKCTYFEIKYTKNPSEILKKDHYCVLKNGKKRYMYFKDTRTNNWVPISYGILEKHMFMNISLETLMIYISYLCNPNSSTEEIEGIIKYEEVIKEELNFFITDIEM